MSKQRFSSLAEFWPYYVQEHSHPWTRRMHFIGNTNLLVWLVAAILRRRPALLGVAVVSSYALAWIGHFFIERNIPATFKYPLLSARADMLMYSKMLRGQMEEEVARYAPQCGGVV
jgi:hypothetical protein